jgi:hypothetical protein
MKHLNVKAFAALGIFLTIVIWLILLYLSGLQLQATWQAFKQLPTVLSIELVLWAIFVKWGWRYKIFQNWLVPFPYIQGTWRGTLTSTWIDPGTKQAIDPVDIVLVIRQSFLSIHCTVFTRESESRSHSASIHIDLDSGEKRLVYTYTNKPRTTIRDRSAIHDGTASLVIVNTPPDELKGEYWTSRKTTGEISLTFHSRTLLEKYPN